MLLKNKSTGIHSVLVWSILLTSLAITLACWVVTHKFMNARAQDRFVQRTEEVKRSIFKRMQDYEQVLRGGIGLFKSSTQVDRKEWHDYVLNLELDRYYPGIQGMGYSMFIMPEQLAEHEATVRAEGFPDYRVRPEGKRNLYSSIIYLEPFDIRNRRAFGYDMYSQWMRQAAMEQARDTGLPAVSGIVTLVQEMETDIQKGFLVYLPLYANGTPYSSIEERRKNIIGYVYSAFRVNDLMEGLLGATSDDIAFSVYDGDIHDNNNILYNSSNTVNLYPKHHFLFEKQSSVLLSGNRTWNLFLQSNNSFLEPQEQALPFIVLLCGCVISGLLYLVFSMILRSEKKARLMAHEMTLELRETSLRLSLAVDSARIGIWGYDIRKGTLNWDNCMFSLYGINHDNFSGLVDVWESSIHPDDHDACMASLSSAIQGTGEYNPVFRIVRPDGVIKYIKANAHVVRDDEGHPLNMVGINMDITEQVDAEEKLALSNRAIDAATYGVVITRANNDQPIIFVNPAFESITGYTAAEVIGRNCRFLLDDQHDQEDLHIIREAIKQKKSCSVILKNKRKSGETFWNKLSLSPVKNRMGVPSHFIAIQEDITYEKEQEKRLHLAMSHANEMADKAEAANRAKSAFLATMSHEIRTPMNGVIGMTSLLMNTELSTEQGEFVSAINISGENLLSLINDILDFSKIEAGQCHLEEICFDLYDCIFNSLTFITPKARSKALELSYYIDPNTPKSLCGDQNRIQQILNNILSNAVKFTDKGGIEISVHCRPDQGGDWVLQCSVSDTGIGIDLEAQKRLFTPFTQADSSITRRYGGSGLGLVICKKLTHLMGGDISIKSDVEKGSTFTFFVKLKSSHLNTKVFEQEQSLLLGKKVLVVDDNITNLKFLSAQTQSWGMSCQLAESADRALELARKDIPDIVITDYSMPDKDGIFLAKELHDTISAAVPIVLLSSIDNINIQSTGTHINAILLKPVKSSKLYNCLCDSLSLNQNIEDVKTDLGANAIDPTMSTNYPLNILVAEDNKMNQDVILLILSKLGYTADIAEDGAIAVELAKLNNYDLILMDLQMPNMSGIEATIGILDALPLSLLPKIVALTANTMSEDVAECRRVGMYDYLSKPIRPHAIISVIKSVYSETKSNVHTISNNKSTLPNNELLDYDQINMVKQFSDQSEFEKLYASVPSFIEEHLQNLRSALPTGENAILGKILHSLKGTAANFGMKLLYNRLTEGEHMLLSAKSINDDYINDISHIVDLSFQAFIKESYLPKDFSEKS